MKEQIKEATEWIKSRPMVDGCITGSTMLGYFPDQDIDVFTYTKESFTELMYAMIHNPKFTILEDLEEWKTSRVRTRGVDNGKFGVLTIKFLYNTCVPVNIVFKKGCYNIFSVMSSFDLDIICKGYDLKSKQILDLSENLPDKQATWNKWNKGYYSDEVWEISRLLRQIVRCFKYYKRGYNTDLLVHKYLEKLIELENYENLFKSENFAEKLENTKEGAKIVRGICEEWLRTHEISDEQVKLLIEKTYKL